MRLYSPIRKLKFAFNKGASDLNGVVSQLNMKNSKTSMKLIKYLKLKDKLQNKLDRSFDTLTAILQATSLKRSMYTYVHKN